MKKSLHSLCCWTFHSGKGGFVPKDSIPSWSSDKLDAVGVVRLIGEKIAPRLPDWIHLGLEAHYDYEAHESNAGEIAGALVDSGMHLAMISPGAHRYFAYGGISSLDEREQELAAEFGAKAVDLAYGPLKTAWHPDPALAPCFVIWNGSFGYDLASVGIRAMYENLKKNVARLCAYEKQKGGALFMGIEPKPNEGHPALLLPTVASALVFWKRLEAQFGTDLKNKGVNKEFGHSEMIGLDHVYDTVEEVDNSMLVHMHMNSQGYNDGIILGGPGKYDIDHGVRINGMNIAIAGLIREAGFSRWKGHDMQVRPYDNEDQAIDRVVRSVLSWEACARAEEILDQNGLMACLSHRETARAEDMIRHAVAQACSEFSRLYKG